MSMETSPRIQIPTNNSRWRAPDLIMSSFQHQMNAGVPLNVAQTRILLATLTTDPKPINVPDNVFIKSTDLNFLLLFASANGYNDQHTGMYTYNWQNPHNSDFAQMRFEKIFWEKEFEKKNVEARELQKKIDEMGAKLLWENKMLREALAAKDVRIEELENEFKTLKPADEPKPASSNTLNTCKIKSDQVSLKPIKSKPRKYEKAKK